MPIIWPLIDRRLNIARIVSGSPENARTRPAANRLIISQQRPRASANLALVQRPALPWSRTLSNAQPQVVRAITRGVPSFPADPPPRSDVKTSRIIWPLWFKLFSPTRIVSGHPDNMRTRAAVHGRIYIQQGPRAIRTPLPILPWDRNDAPTEPGIIKWLAPPIILYAISGVTRNSAGTALGFCDVHLFRTSDDLEIDQTTSDASGIFVFRSVKSGIQHYIVAYKAGSPDVAGTSVNTLTGT